MSDPEVIAYAYKVKGPYSGEFTLRVDFDDPRETWRDDHEIRDVVELANIKEIEGETLTQYADAEASRRTRLAMSDYRIIRELDEHPIPTDEEDIADLWENHDSPGEPPHPDVAHDEYVNTIAEHGVWHVFRTHYPFESRGIVFWNRAFGSGFTIDDSEGQWHHMVNLFAEIVSQEGDCRDAETSDSLMQCSGYRQRCKNCGDSWTVG